MYTYLFYRCGKCGSMHLDRIWHPEELRNLIQHGRITRFPNRQCGPIIVKSPNVALVAFPYTLGTASRSLITLLMDTITSPSVALTLHETHPELFLLKFNSLY